MSGPRRSSGSWRDRQERDPYVRKARREGWRSRSVYKLEEIAERETILRPGMTCVDLGAAPGGWSQFVGTRLKDNVRIVALDMLPMDALPGVQFIQGDITDDAVLERLVDALGNSGADLVMSDMAPNISGNRAVDQPRSMHLAELALDTARKVLKRHGNLVCKVFQGDGSDALVAEARRHFGKVRIMKPKASRPGSHEVYLVARNYQL
ncbi:MAG TPA: RlmE family RNA methyltransferase [Woeseiaceae bacterium]|nr:RlmE family RNA methyltransferase [Woeseiaceae bacterium]